jgi:hypothetical protein
VRLKRARAEACAPIGSVPHIAAMVVRAAAAVRCPRQTVHVVRIMRLAGIIRLGETRRDCWRGLLLPSSIAIERLFECAPVEVWPELVAEYEFCVSGLPKQEV